MREEQMEEKMIEKRNEQQKNEVQNSASTQKKQLTPAEIAEKQRQLRETENFKRKYFEYYDDVKISHREDW